VGTSGVDADDLDMVITPARPEAEEATAPKTAWFIGGAVVSVALFALIVAWGFVSGAVGRAYSDDWGYLRIVQQFLRTGHITGVGWNDTSLIGQLLASRILSPLTGSTIAGVRALSIVCAAGSLVLVAVLARAARTRHLWPVVPLTVVATIGFGSTVVTYMTEQPALVAQLGAIALGLLAWRRWERLERLPITTIVGIVAVGAWAGSIRQAAIAAPLSALAALLTHPSATRRDRQVVLAAAGVVCASVLLVMAFSPLNGPTMAIVRGSVTGQVARIYQAAATVAVFLFPLAVITGWAGRALTLTRQWSTSRNGRIVLALTTVTVIFGALLLDHRNGSVLVGNSLQQAGGYQGTDVAFPALFDPVTWRIIEVLGAAALFLLVVVALDGVRHLVAILRTAGRGGLRAFADRATPLSRVVTLWTVVSVLSALFVNLAYRAIYDRYLVPVVIGLALLAVDNVAAGSVRETTARRRVVWMAVAFVPVIVLGALSATDSQDIVDLRWSGAERLVALGYKPETIDAGFDWVGYHYPGQARPDTVVTTPATYPPASYDAYFPTFVRCAIVSGLSQPPPGYVPLDRIRHRRMFGLRSTTAYLYGSTSAGTGCPRIAGP
jgi:hypothetical protein